MVAQQQRDEEHTERPEHGKTLDGHGLCSHHVHYGRKNISTSAQQRDVWGSRVERAREENLQEIVAVELDLS